MSRNTMFGVPTTAIIMGVVYIFLFQPQIIDDILGTSFSGNNTSIGEDIINESNIVVEEVQQNIKDLNISSQNETYKLNLTLDTDILSDAGLLEI